MKRIKKLLCILLAALLLLTTGAFAVSAEEPVQPDMEALHQKFIAYLDEQGVEHSFDGKEGSKIDFIIEISGWTVFYGMTGTESPMVVSDRIENYVFVNSSWQIPYRIGLYAEKQGLILTLKEACQTETLNIEKIVKNLPKYIYTYEPGDIDMDFFITVKDVISVQRAIAKQVDIFEQFDFAFYDYDGNGNINVKDALDMQKKIAKMSE